MRFSFACAAVLVVAACKKPEKKAAPPAKPVPAPTQQGFASQAKPAPEPPAPSDPAVLAIRATIDVLDAVAPITKKWGNEGKACENGIPEVEKVFDSMKVQLDLVKAAEAVPASAKTYDDAYFAQDGGPLDTAKSAALGPALHCPKLAARIQAAFGFKMAQ
jgi:hypothetical protein